MATGNISLTFETPDIAFTGTGEFDISEAFRSLITSNEQIKDEISKKIAQIFRNIPAKEVADEWVTKIKKSFNLETMAIDLTKEVEKKSKELIKTMTFGQVDMAAAVPSMNRPAKKALPSMDMDFKGFFKDLSENFDKFFIRMDKQLSINPSTQSPQKSWFKDLLDRILPAKESTFDPSNEVIIGDFTDKALTKLASLFSENLQKWKKTPKESGQDDETPSQSWLSKLIDKYLPEGAAMGVAGAIGSLLKKPSKAIGAGLIVWGAYEAALDAIKAYAKKDEWGVDGLSASIGGFLGGMVNNGKGGIESAWAKAGQFAKIGAGIGLMFPNPIIGMLMGGLLGAALGGILGYIGAEDIAKALNNLGKDIGKIFTKNLNDSLTKKSFQTIGLIKVEDDKTQEIRHGFFNAFVLSPIKFWINKNKLKATEAVAKSFGVGGEVIEKMAIFGSKGLIQAGGKEILTKALKLGLMRVLKYVPILSAVIGCIEAFNYFSNNQILEGFIALGSGIAGVFPGLGTGISILLDVVNMGLTNTETGKLTSKNFTETWGKMTEFLKRVPIIGSMIYISEALGDFSAGNWKEGFQKLGYAGLGLTGLNMFIEPEKFAEIVPIITLDWTKKLFDGLLHGFDILWDWIGNLGTMIKEKLSSWWSGKEKPTTSSNATSLSPNQIISPKNLKIPTQALIVEPKGITFQPHNQDKLYKMKENSIYAKPDDMLGKTFQSIDKQLIALNTLTQKTMHKLDEHSEIFKSLLKVNQQQLGILPALAPQPMVQPKQFVNNEKNDRIHEMRQQYRPNIWKDL